MFTDRTSGWLRAGEHHILAAVGVEAGENQQRNGRKHVLGIAEGASENQVLAKALLENLVARGLDLRKRYLFVIDGSKALRAAIDPVFGTQQGAEPGSGKNSTRLRWSRWPKLDRLQAVQEISSQTDQKG